MRERQTAPIKPTNKKQGDDLPSERNWFIMEKKMTKKDYFNKLLAITDVKTSDELTAFIKHELELLDRKNSKDRKPTANQIANEGLKQEVLQALVTNGGLMTVTEIIKNNDNLGEYSNQRISALLRQLIESGKVEKIVEKRKSYFKAV